MKILLIDAGNSSLKCATLNNHKLSEYQSYFYAEKAPDKVLENIINNYKAQCQSVILVSVLGDDFVRHAQKIINGHTLQFRNIQSIEQLAGVSNAYTEPHKLGADRFVAMIAAHKLSINNDNTLVASIIIDCGTATTIDAVDHNGQHLGGLILPGVNLCQKSLLSETQQLKKWTDTGAEFTPTLFARNTTEAISSASILGQASAINGICSQMKKSMEKQHNAIKIEKYLCGGGVQQLLPFLSSGYQVQKDLVLLGLQTIIEKEKN